MTELHKIYRPLTAHPFEHSIEYAEYEPCEALKPYIRCFWGSKMPYARIWNEQGEAPNTLVAPDTCMDIMFTVNYTDNRIYNQFCGIDDSAFLAESDNNGKTITTFAIRFYPWSVCLFAEDSIRDCKNQFYDVSQHFGKLRRALEPLLFDVATMPERILIAEKYLLSNIHREKMNMSVMEATAAILQKKGNVKIQELAGNVLLGPRQLERLFREYMGISPKQFSTLVRYQYLWNEIVYNKDFHILDAVSNYGYTDQAHLVKEFKKYHLLTISEARQYARRTMGKKDVALLQDR